MKFLVNVYQQPINFRIYRHAQFTVFADDETEAKEEGARKARLKFNMVVSAANVEIVRVEA